MLAIVPHRNKSSKDKSEETKMNPEIQVEAINTREDFVAFVRSLALSIKADPGTWDNLDLESFLDALAAWVEDMDGYFENRGESCPQSPSWKLAGQMLCAARVYE